MKRKDQETFEVLVHKQVKIYARFFKEKNLKELIIEEKGFKTTFRKEFFSPYKTMSVPSGDVSGNHESSPSPDKKKTSIVPTKPKNQKQITSPITGIFYAAPSPNADPFVKVGDTINKNTPVCIIEAMKNMNEIKAEVQGKITEIVIQNAEPVQAGDVLMILE